MTTATVETKGLEDVERILRELTRLQGSKIALAAPGVHQPRSVSQARSGRKPRAFQRLASFSRQRVMIADLYRFHEFGTSRVPARQPIRATLFGKRDKIDKRIEGAVQRVIASKGRWSAEQAHANVGKFVVAEMRRTIKARLTPGLAESTASDPDRDKRGIPLYDTRQMYDALEHRSEGL
jgi:hypothetical protein